MTRDTKEAIIPHYPVSKLAIVLAAYWTDTATSFTFEGAIG
jgi:hypothetical protein